ncbi:MAG TPA: hypothetical protein V6D22_23345 [Candidatus Obscuribacterales bacterium]
MQLSWLPRIIHENDLEIHDEHVWHPGITAQSGSNHSQSSGPDMDLIIQQMSAFGGNSSVSLQSFGPTQNESAYLNILLSSSSDKG